MSNILTVSRITSRQTCARKHKLEYLDGWRPAVEPEYFGVGRLFHVGMKAWWASATTGGDALFDGVAAVVGGTEDPFRAVVVEEMLRAYHDRWIGSVGDYELVANEDTFTLPLVNPETGASSRTWVLGGVVDKVVREKSTGRLLLIEHKTSSEAIEDPADPYWAKLAMDSQVSQYVLGAEALGFLVEGCLYDVAKKPGQRPLKATPIEDRKYTKGKPGEPSRLYANQRETDETPAEFRERVRAALTENRDRYFQRREVARLESQIVEHLYDVWSIGQQIRDDERLGRAPRNTRACHQFGVCAYWGICATGMKPEEHPEAFVLVDNVHPEMEVAKQS